MVDLIGGAIGAQAPVVEQVVVDVQLLADIVQAISNGAEQAALNNRLGRFCSFVRLG
ncbi:hypothetical protein D3C77_623440 [compost metagenome]